MSGMVAVQLKLAIISVIVMTNAWGAEPLVSHCKKLTDDEVTKIQTTGTDAQLSDVAKCIATSGNKARAVRLIAEKLGDKYRDSSLLPLLKSLSKTFVKEDHRRRFRLGLDQAREGKIAEASDIWERILREDGAQWEVWEKYIESLDSQNTYSKLWSERERLTEYFPHSDLGRLLLAKAALKRDSLDWAFRLVQPLFPTKDPRVVHTYAEALFRNGQQVQAIDFLREQLKHPELRDPRCVFQLARFIFTRSGSTEEVKLLVKEVMEKTKDAKSPEELSLLYREAKTFQGNLK